ncbi:MAG: class I SAM-dependent methyltransferase [Anaerolineales bacterium]|jgi:SAM-dependent methyltransferase|nr:class I SAM-dependent methyltransferase [Anaerolineales bacterium]
MSTTEAWHQRYSQQARWTAGIRQYLFEQVDLRKTDSLLEAGCGTGAILSDLAVRFPNRLFGLDISRPYLHLASQQVSQAAFSQADAHYIPFREESFNIVLCHFFLLWVSQPEQVVREMTRVLKTGGALLALAEPDYGGRIDYPDGLIMAGQMQTQALRGQGANPEMGRQLAQLLLQAGLADIQVGVLGGQWPIPSRSNADWEAEWAITESDLTGWVSESELKKIQALEERAWKAGERILFVPTFYAWGRKI